ncbi:MAG: hypothetical protein HN413_07990 [Chloroflexi bacterium]|nr:hypothetical protein [Chloroflexota bacterium]
MIERPDDPRAVALHADRFYGGTALIVLGGNSGDGWEKLRDEIEPDVILTANGMTQLAGADYWMLGENMNFCHSRAMTGDDHLALYMHVLDPNNTAAFKMVNHRNFNLLPLYGIDPCDCISIRRGGYDLKDFSLRKYGDGFLNGEISESAGWRKGVRVRKGTVGLQLLHLAGILGCAAVHTIGWDLMFKNAQRHHWYQHPTYEAGRFRNETMFVTHKGVETQDWWLETAHYLRTLEPVFKRDEMSWQDHSDGLLSIEGVWCAG